jgi:hypothetical protein
MPTDPSALHRFQMIVLEDPDLQRELRLCGDRPGFVARVLERACERGCPIEQADVEGALNAAAQEWMMHWVAS